MLLIKKHVLLGIREALLEISFLSLQKRAQNQTMNHWTFVRYMPLFFKIIGKKCCSIEITYHVKGNHALDITNWALDPFDNSILNRLWKLHLHLLAWEIWKEKNKRFFL